MSQQLLNYFTNKKPSSNICTLLPLSDSVITIRAMVNADAAAYATGTEDPLVKKFAHLPLNHYTPQLVTEMIAGVLAEGLTTGTLAILTIADAENNNFIGSIVLFDITANEAEVGYWVSPSYRGKKIATRALILACQLTRKIGLKMLRARTVENNPASKHILLSAGFKQIGTTQPQTLPSGETEICLNYLIDLYL